MAEAKSKVPDAPDETVEAQQEQEAENQAGADDAAKMVDDALNQNSPEKAAKANASASKSKKGKLSDEDSTRVSRFLEHHYGKPIESVEEVDGGFDVVLADGTQNSHHYETEGTSEEFVKGLPGTY